MRRSVRGIESIGPMVRLFLGFAVFTWVLGEIIDTNFHPCPRVARNILEARRSVGLDCSSRGLYLHLAIVAGVLVLGFALWHPRPTTRGRRQLHPPPA